MKNPLFLNSLFLLTVGILLFTGLPTFANPTNPVAGLPDALLLTGQKNAKQWVQKLRTENKALEQKAHDLEMEISRLRTENLRLDREKSFFNSKGKQLAKNKEVLIKLEGLLTQTQSEFKNKTAKAKIYAKQIQTYDEEIQIRLQDKAYLLTDTLDRHETDFLEKSKGAYERTANRLSVYLANLHKSLDEQKKKSSDPLDEKIQAFERSIDEYDKQYRAASFTLQSINGELQRRIGKRDGVSEGNSDLTNSDGPETKPASKAQKSFEHFRGFFRDDLEKEFAQRQEKEKKNVFYLSIGSIAALLISFLFLRKAFS